MWYKTALTEKLGIQYPIIQGPFGGGPSSVKLLSTVSNAGGLGSFGAFGLSPQQIIDLDKELKASTDKPYAINLWVSENDERLKTYSSTEYEILLQKFKPYFDELGVALPPMPAQFGKNFEDQFEALLKARPPVFSFVYGIPSKEILTACKRSGIKTAGAATTVDEAVALEESGVDAIIATGFEAGGHRVSFLRDAEDSLTGIFALIPQVADKVKIPFAAAGGIADARGIAAALTLGASGAQIGTAFLACEESNATDLHREALFSSEAKYTTLTKAFSGRLARGIRSRLSEDMKNFQNEMAPFPMQSIFLRTLREAAIAQNKNGFVSFWSGQAAPIIKHKKAAALFSSLVQETSAIFNAR
jgi:nitronate monooxygenase